MPSCSKSGRCSARTDQEEVQVIRRFWNYFSRTNRRHSMIVPMNHTQSPGQTHQLKGVAQPIRQQSNLGLPSDLDSQNGINTKYVKEGESRYAQNSFIQVQDRIRLTLIQLERFGTPRPIHYLRFSSQIYTYITETFLILLKNDN